MVMVMALVFSCFSYFQIERQEALKSQCLQISSKFRILKLWISINCYFGLLVIPAYLLMFCYARFSRVNDDRQRERDRQDEQFETMNHRNEIRM